MKRLYEKAFNEEYDMNRVKEMYSGEQRKMLLEYGSIFKVVPFKDDMFKLEKVEEDTSSEENAIAEAKASLDDFVKNVEFGSDDDLPF